MLSRLDVINDMITSTGAVALNTEQARHPLYQKAERKLTRVNSAVQAMGLYFNTETRDILANTEGEIVVPQNCLRADPVDRKFNLTLRGRRMWDLDKATYNIGGTRRLKMSFELPFTEVPPVCQEFIAAKSVYEFYRDEDGADPKLREYKSSMAQAWQMLWREHTRNRQVNVYDNPSNMVNRLRTNQTAYSRRRNLWL